MRDEFAELRRRQDGAFTRAQARRYGVSDQALASRCRSARIQRIHKGVCLGFTGPVPWSTRVWAAWLAHGPDAALAGETALRLLGMHGNWDDDTIELEVPHSRRVSGGAGVRLVRRRDHARRVFGAREPAVVRLEVAALGVASRRVRDDLAVALVLDAVRQLCTTAARLVAELEAQPCLPRRDPSCPLTGQAWGVFSPQDPG